jgi:serine/threonine protein kinase
VGCLFPSTNNLQATARKQQPITYNPITHNQHFMKTAKAQLQDGRELLYFPKKKLGEGTEKEFFATADENTVIGFYLNENESLDPERLKRLTYIIEKYNPTLDADKGELWKKHFCWPLGIVISPRRGIAAPRFSSQYYFSDSKGEKKSTWFSKPGLLKKLKKEETGDWLNRIQLCRHLSRAIRRMHMAGLAHSDLSGNNILADPANGTCLIIDIDSLVVPGMFPSKVLGTRGYMAPEVVMTSHLPLKNPHKILPSIKTDLHSLAVIIYEILLLRHPLKGKKIHAEDPDTDDLLRFGKNALFVEHPSDRSNCLNASEVPLQVLGPYLVPLFQRAFIEGLHAPDQRPTAHEWEDALTYTMDILYPCNGEECWHKWFVCHKEIKAVCPFCKWESPDNIPIMNLFRRYKTGRYVSENHYLPIWDQKKIYEWHIRSDISYPDDMLNDFQSQASFSLQNKRWKFKNEGNEHMLCSASEYIRPGESVDIADKSIVLLNKHPKGRLAVFEILCH